MLLKLLYLDIHDKLQVKAYLKRPITITKIPLRKQIKTVSSEVYQILHKIDSNIHQVHNEITLLYIEVKRI